MQKNNINISQSVLDKDMFFFSLVLPLAGSSVSPVMESHMVHVGSYIIGV